MVDEDDVKIFFREMNSENIFHFLQEYEGKGYGYEAASRLLKAGKEDFGLQKVCAITTKENVTSQKLIDKLGLKFIKIITIEGDKENLMYFEKEL